MGLIYWEDFEPHRKNELGGLNVEIAEIIEFARRWDSATVSHLLRRHPHQSIVTASSLRRYTPIDIVNKIAA